MKMTVKDILKSLPFDDMFKRTLMGQLDTLDPHKKFIIEETLWDTYDALLYLKIEEKVQLGLDKVRRGEIELSDDLYRNARREAEEEMEKGFFQHTTDQDLMSIRSKLQTLMKQN